MLITDMNKIRFVSSEIKLKTRWKWRKRQWNDILYITASKPFSACYPLLL